MANKIITSAISAVLALGINQVQANNEEPVPMMPMIDFSKMEKCYGISQPGQNDCGNATHGCSGEQKVAADKNEWLAVPKGLCHKIVGGSLTPKDKI